MSIDTQHLNPLDVVQYTDMANPSRKYLVMGRNRSPFGEEFILIDIDTREDFTSDCRQSGWSRIGRLADLMK